MTLQMALRKVGADFAAIVPNCFHYFRPKMEPPFLVWQEDGEGDDFHANNRKAERQISCSASYYTQQEYDPVLDQIETLLEKFSSGWQLVNVTREDETALIHYEWSFSVALRGGA